MLDVPVLADDLEQARGSDAVRRQTGQAIRDFLLHGTGSDVDAAAGDPKHLRQPRPLEIADQGIADHQ